MIPKAFKEAKTVIAENFALSFKEKDKSYKVEKVQLTFFPNYAEISFQSPKPKDKMQPLFYSAESRKEFKKIFEPTTKEDEDTFEEILNLLKEHYEKK